MINITYDAKTGVAIAEELPDIGTPLPPPSSPTIEQRVTTVEEEQTKIIDALATALEVQI